MKNNLNQHQRIIIKYIVFVLCYKLLIKCFVTRNHDGLLFETGAKVTCSAQECLSYNVLRVLLEDGTNMIILLYNGTTYKNKTMSQSNLFNLFHNIRAC